MKLFAQLRNTGSLIVLCAGSLLALVVLFFVYSLVLQQSIATEVQNYISEITKQSKQNIVRQLEAHVGSLVGVASMLDNKALENPADAMQTLMPQQAIFAFRRFGLVFPDGRMFTTDDVVHIPNVHPPFVERVLNGESGISTTFPDCADGTSSYIYYAPIHKNGKVVAGLFATCKSDNLSNLLRSDFFYEAGYTHLVQQNGETIQTSNRLALHGQNNILTLIDIEGKNSQFSSQELGAQWKNNESGRLDYTVRGQHRYVYYTPLGINDWYLLSVIPATEVDRRTKERLLWTFGLVSAIILLLGLVWSRLFAREKELKEAVARNMEELRTITANIPGGMMRCEADEWLTMGYVSDGFIDMVGYSHDELQSIFYNKFFSMLHSDDLFPTLRIVEEQLSKGDTLDLQFRIIRSDCSIFWAHLKGQRMEKNGEHLLYCVLMDETEMRTAMDIVHMDAARYSVLLKLADMILFEFDLRTGQLTTSPKFEETFGYQLPTARFPQCILDEGLLYKEDIPSFTYLFDSIYSGESEAETEVRLCKSDETFIWCRIRVMGVLDKNHICTKAIGKIIDIDAQMQELLKLKEEIQRDPFTQLYNKVATTRLATDCIGLGNPGALFLIDVDNFKRINDEMGHAVGDTVLLSLSARLQGLFRRSDIVGRIGGDEFAVYLQHASSSESLHEKAESICRIFSMPVGDGIKTITVSGSVGVAVFPDDGQDYNDLYTKADAALYESKRKGKNCYTLYSSVLQQEDSGVATLKKTHILSCDPLTGIATCSTFEEQGEIMLREAAEAKLPLAIFSIKVHGLQHINSLRGTVHGDAVLMSMVGCIRGCLPPVVLFARCRGNDFGLILPLDPKFAPELQVVEFIEKIKEPLGTALPSASLPWTKLCTGVALFPEHGETLQVLHRKASQAEAQCNSTELISFIFYDEVQMERLRVQEELKLDLLVAARRNELELFFQPIVHRSSGFVASAEALLRWNHQTRGRLDPNEFIPIAEQALIIPAIDSWVINQVCAEWRRMFNEGVSMVPVSINLSLQKFFQANLIEVIHEALHTYNIPRGMLTVELSERSVMSDLNKAQEIISNLRNDGVNVSIDDFGTGYSSFSYLRTLPIAEVKLNRSFVTDDSPTAVGSLRSIVDLLKVYKVRVVIEGVELAEQFERVEQTGCDLVQGYYTGRPMRSDELGIRLREQAQSLGGSDG